MKTVSGYHRIPQFDDRPESYCNLRENFYREGVSCNGQRAG
jgi:hypothetical protein